MPPFPLQIITWLGTRFASDDEDEEVIARDPFRVLGDFGYDRPRFIQMRISSFGQIPSARMRLCPWIARVTSQAMRDAFTIYHWDDRLSRNRFLELTAPPLLPPCTWCGLPTGCFCDICANTGIKPALPLCKSCDELFDCCRKHYPTVHNRQLRDPINGPKLIVRTLKWHRDRYSVLYRQLYGGEYASEHPNTWWHDRFVNGFITHRDRGPLFPADPDFEIHQLYSKIRIANAARADPQQ
jgi:hypothetical protein